MSNPLKRRKVHRAALASVKAPQAPVPAPAVQKAPPAVTPEAATPKVEKAPESKVKKGLLKW